MPESIACPHCGAPLEVRGDRPQTIRCSFCGQTSRISGHGQPRVARATVVRLAPRLSILLWLLGALLVLGLIGGGLALAVGAGALPILLAGRTFGEAPSGIVDDLAADGWARQVVSFGGEGIGPGLFQDARHIGVDAQGRVYVGEYQGGRIQVFDSEGGFLTQWFADRELPLTGMAVSREGTVYAVQGGEIMLRDGMSGAALGQRSYAEGDYFEDVSLQAGGGMAAAWYANRDDIVIFDAQGEPLQTIEAALSGLTGESELSMRLAVDGQDNLYVLGLFHEAVFRFDANGRYVSRFGSQGDEPGQFTAPGPIAVDDQGRVYVGDFQGVQVFDATGRYLRLVEVNGYPHGLTIDPQGDLWVAAGTQVYEFDVPEV